MREKKLLKDKILHSLECLWTWLLLTQQWDCRILFFFLNSHEIVKQVSFSWNYSPGMGCFMNIHFLLVSYSRMAQGRVGVWGLEFQGWKVEGRVYFWAATRDWKVGDAGSMPKPRLLRLTCHPFFVRLQKIEFSSTKQKRWKKNKRRKN